MSAHTKPTLVPIGESPVAEFSVDLKKVYILVDFFKNILYNISVHSKELNTTSVKFRMSLEDAVRNSQYSVCGFLLG